MRLAILTFTSLLLWTASAAAQGNAPFCVQGMQGDVVSCRYMNMAQCRADVSGRLGICFPNPRWQAQGSGYGSAYGYDSPRRRR